MGSKNIGSVGHVNHGETSLTEAIDIILGKRGTCTACQGQFQRNEEIYRDTDNQTYCEACYGDIR